MTGTTGAVAVNAAVSTGTSLTTGGATDTSISGNITIVTTSTITGDASGTLTTGSATGSGFQNGDTATSGFLSLSAGGAIQLAATDALHTGDAIMTSAQSSDDPTTTGSITIVDANKLTSNGTTGQVDISIGTITSIGTPKNAGTFIVTTTDGGAGDAGAVYVTTAENLSTGTIGASGNVDIDATSTAAVTITSTITTTSGTIDITAAGAALTINQSINSSAASKLTTLIATDLVFGGSGAITTGGGGITIKPVGSSDLGIGAGAGTFNLIDADIGKLSTSGTLTIGDATNTGAIDIDGVTNNTSITGPVSILGNSIEVTGMVFTSASSVTLTADTGAITDGGGTTDITAGDLTLNAKTGIGSADAIETSISFLTLTNDGGSGSVQITESNGVALNLINNTVNNITLISTLGAITDNNADATNITAGSNISLTAQTGIGSGNALETTMQGLEAKTTLSGNVEIIATPQTTGITINGAGVQTAGGGNIAITLTAGDLILDEDITANGAGTVDITLNGAGASITTNQAIEDIASTSGAITIIADALNLASGAIDTSGAITLKPKTEARSIGIGGGTGDFELGDTEIALLGQNTDPSLITIGATDAGAAVDIDAVTFADALTVVGDSIAVTGLDAGANAVTLTADTGAITDGSGNDTTDITAGDTVLTGATGIDVDTDIARLSASTTASGDINILETDDLTIFSPGGNGASVKTVNNGNIDITLTTGNLTLDSDITANGVGTVDITLNGSGAALITSADADDIASTDGAITIIADTLTLAEGDIETDGAITLKPKTADRTIGIGTGASGDFNLDATEVGLLGTALDPSLITIGDSAAGDVDINASTFTDALTVVGDSITVTGLNAGANAVILTADTGAITDGGGTTDITASSLVATAVTGVDVDTAVTNLEAEISGTGGIDISNTGNLTIGSIGATTGVSTNDGTIDITAASTLTVSEAITAGGTNAG